MGVWCHTNIVIYGDEDRSFVWYRGLGVPICHHLERTGIDLHVWNAVCCYTLRQTELSPLKIKDNLFYFREMWWCPQKTNNFWQVEAGFSLASWKKHQRKRRMGCSTSGFNHWVKFLWTGLLSDLPLAVLWWAWKKTQVNGTEVLRAPGELSGKDFGSCSADLALECTVLVPWLIFSRCLVIQVPAAFLTATASQNTNKIPFDFTMKMLGWW